jgi:hypothetical protein
MYRQKKIGLSILIALFITGAAASFFSSCGKGGTVSPSALNIQYQIINLSPDLGSVDLYIQFLKFNKTSYFYPNSSGYFFLTSIDTPFQIRPGTSATPGSIVPDSNIFVLNNTLKPNLKYTLMIMGFNKSDSLSYIFTADTSASPSLGRGKIRFINATPRTAALDVSANGTPVFTGVPYKGIVPYREIPAGTYDFKIFPKGGTLLLQDLPNIIIQDGRLYTMYTYGLAGHTDTLAFGTRVIVNK